MIRPSSAPRALPDFDRILITCEHAGNRVPARWRGLFASLKAKRALRTHRGVDLGALTLARSLHGALARRSGAVLASPLLFSTTTRLLVDLNRSPANPALFSEFSRTLDRAEWRIVLARHYLPHRVRVLEAIARQVRAGRRVLHVGVHTFTPELGGAVRTADVGLLYDPVRRLESALCARWIARIRAAHPDLRLRRNYPYLGRSDGLITALRRRFPARAYAGVELEVNQALVGANVAQARRFGRSLALALSGAAR